MKNKLLAVIIALAMVLSTASISFAGESIEPASDTKDVVSDASGEVDEGIGEKLGNSLNVDSGKSALEEMAAGAFGFLEFKTGWEKPDEYVRALLFSNGDVISPGKHGVSSQIKITKKGVLYLGARAESQISTRSVTYGLFYDKNMTSPVKSVNLLTSTGSLGQLGEAYYNVQPGTYYLGVYSNLTSNDQVGVVNLAAFIDSGNRTLVNDKYTAVGQLTPQSNHLKFKAKYTGYLKVNTTLLDGTIQLLNSSKKGLSTKKSITEEYPTTMYGVTKGKTYYLSITGSTNPLGRYMIKVKNASISEKSGSSKSKAKSISKGKAKTGTITAGSSRADWYKFKLSGKKNVSVKMTGSNCDKLVMTVYKGSKKVKSITFTNKTASAKIYGPFPKGTYYVKISRGNSGSSGYYKLTWK